jgi:glycosyltransferase involved in cell wall biosynthesis
MVDFIYKPQSKAQDLSKLRIAIVSDASPHRNGVGSYYRDLIGQIRHKVDTINLVAPTRINAGMYLLSLPMPGDSSQKIRIPNIPVLFRHLAKIDPSVIVLPSPGPFGMAGLLYAMKHRIPICVGMHTDYDKLTDLYWNGIFGDLSRNYLRSIHRLLVRCSDAVMVTNQELLQTATDLGARNIELLGSLLPKRYIDTPVSDRPQKLKRILFAGRLAHEKNLDAVLHAADQLPEIMFTIAGDGPMKEEVIEFASLRHNLTYLGWLSRGNLMHELDRNDMLVLPSHLETFGTVALEAAARARLVLASPSCGILGWEQFRGKVISMQQRESVADAIRRVAAIPSDQRTSIRYAMQQTAHAFNNETLSQWESLLLALANTDKTRNVEQV